MDLNNLVRNLKKKAYDTLQGAGNSTARFINAANPVLARPFQEVGKIVRDTPDAPKPYIATPLIQMARDATMATYKFADVNQTPNAVSKEGLSNYMDAMWKGGVKLPVYAWGAAHMTPATLLSSGAFGGAIGGAVGGGVGAYNAPQGQKMQGFMQGATHGAKEGFDSGINFAPFMPVLGVTNKVQGSIINKATANIADPLKQAVGKRVVGAGTNIVEGIGLNTVMGRAPLDPMGLLIDTGFGAGLPAGSGQAMKSAFGKGTDGIFPEDARAAFDISKRIKEGYWKMSDNGYKIADLEGMEKDKQLIDGMLQHYFGTPLKELKAMKIEDKVQKIIQEGADDFRNSAPNTVKMGIVGDQAKPTAQRLTDEARKYNTPEEFESAVLGGKIEPAKMKEMGFEFVNQGRIKNPEGKELTEIWNEAKQTNSYILPSTDSISQEAKRVGAKRLSPDRVPHQQLRPDEGITALVAAQKKRLESNSNSWVKAAERIDPLIQKYGGSLPPRTEQNIQKYPNLMDDYRLYSDLKKYSVGARSLEDMKKQFMDRGQSMMARWTPEAEAKALESAKKDYIDLVRKDISRGYKFPDEVLNYDKSFKTAVDNRARYEKGLFTSFSADDQRIVFDDQNRIVAGMKRQDGKELLPEQKQEIVDGVIQTQKALGIDLNAISKDERWVYAHLNGKNPFLTQNAAGLYRPADGSVSVSLGGTEGFESIVNGERVRSKVNTTVAHEIGHALDYNAGKKLISDEAFYKLRNSYKPTVSYGRGDKYWRNRTEVTARAIEQYVAVKEGHTAKFNHEGYWDEKTFNTIIKPEIEKAIGDKFSQYKTAEVNPTVQGAIKETGGRLAKAEVDETVPLANGKAWIWKGKGEYVPRVEVGGKQTTIGKYKTIEEARKALQENVSPDGNIIERLEQVKETPQFINSLREVSKRAESEGDRYAVEMVDDLIRKSDKMSGAEVVRALENIEKNSEGNSYFAGGINSIKRNLSDYLNKPVLEAPNTKLLDQSNPLLSAKGKSLDEFMKDFKNRTSRIEFGDVMADAKRGITNEDIELNRAFIEAAQKPEYQKIYENGGNDDDVLKALWNKANKQMTAEQVIETAGGWKAGTRQAFDTALFNKDKAKLQELLPTAPQEYKERFAKEISAVLGSEGVMQEAKGVSSNLVSNKPEFDEAAFKETFETEQSIRDNVQKIQQDFLAGKITMEQRKQLADKEFARSTADNFLKNQLTTAQQELEQVQGAKQAVEDFYTNFTIGDKKAVGQLRNMLARAEENGGDMTSVMNSKLYKNNIDSLLAAFKTNSEDEVINGIKNAPPLSQSFNIAPLKQTIKIANQKLEDATKQETGRPLTMGEFNKQSRAANKSMSGFDEPNFLGGGSKGNPSNPVDKIIKALKAAEPLRGDQEAIYSAERSKRIGSAIGVGRSMKGEKGFYGQLSKLKGEMPKITFAPIRNQIGQKDIDSLYTQVRDSKYITEWEKINAQTGLSKLLDEKGGAVPTEGEISLLNEVFGNDFTKAVLDKRGTGDKLLEKIGNILNVPRTVMASTDTSAPFRQGWGLMGKPKQFTEAYKKMFTYLRSEDGYNEMLQSIKDDPNYLKMREGGLSLSNNGALMMQREERFMSNYAEQIPAFGKVVQASDRAYSGFLNKLRSDTFNDMYRKAMDQGLPDTPETYKSIAQFVNIATGRGSLGGLSKASQILSNVFFSPRLFASRVQMFNPKTYIDLPKGVRQQALKAVLGSAGIALTATGLLSAAGADVGTDPTSADFGKVKFGNTRYDLFGGFQQPVRALSQMITGKVTSTTTGKVMTLGEGYKPMTRADVFWHFIQSKESPVTSFVMGLLSGKDGIGQDFNVGSELVGRMMPMVVQDMYDLYKEHGIEGVAMALPATQGIGVQTYGYSPMGKEEKMRAAYLKQQGMADKDINAQLLKEKQAQIAQEQYKADLKKNVREPELPSTKPTTLEEDIWKKITDIIPKAGAAEEPNRMGEMSPEMAAPQTDSEKALKDYTEKFNFTQSPARVMVTDNKLYIKGDKSDSTGMPSVSVVDLAPKDLSSDPIVAAHQVAAQESAIKSKGTSTYFSTALSESDKNKIYEALGTTKSDVEFRAVDSLPTSQKAAVLHQLLSAREYKSDKVNTFIDRDILTSGVVDAMVEQSLLSPERGKSLKAYIKAYNEAQKGTGGRGRKATFPKIRIAKPRTPKAIKISFGKIKGLKPTKIKIGKLKISKPKLKNSALKINPEALS